MLPSFRLIAATFFCGFLAVFAGLRLAASLNDFHEALPVMAAHAAPVTVSPAADREARRGVSSVPMMYDLRFAVSTMSPALVRATPSVFDRLAPPLSIVPSEDIAADTPAMAEPEPPQPERTVAAIPELPDVAEPPPATDTVETPVAEAEIEAMLEVKTAAIAPQVTDQAAPAVEATPADLPVPEASRTVAIDVLAQDAAADAATDTVNPAGPPPDAKPQAAKLKKTVAKAKRVRKKHIRTAHRAAAAHNPLSNPFGGQPQPR
jgi:hypothetical protein